MATNILSVDWDYFFPFLDDYDWGHSEEKFNKLYMEILWPIRASNHDLITGKRAIDIVWPRPEHKTFWDTVIRKPPGMLIISESHLGLYDLINFGPYKATDESIIVECDNYDAHHDYGYGDKAEPDCGNWAKKAFDNGFLSRYTIHYPEWRKDKSENPPEGIGVEFGIPKEHPHYGIVFICRSAAWTPPWADDLWLKFIGWWKENHPRLWRNKVAVDYALKKRPYDQEVADEHERLAEESRKKMEAKFGIKGKEERGENNAGL